MKKLNIKNLTINLADNTQKEDWEKAVSRAFESVSPVAEVVNLVKVKVSDIPLDKVQYILRHIKEDLAEQGLTNCVFVPLHPQGIQDITIEKLEWVDEEERI
jgi:hypothetical protein